jgi:hypothetical protein
MACDLCKNFPARALRELNDDIADGSFSLAELAEKHYVSEPLLEEHIRQCVGPPSGAGHELLEELLREVRRVAEDRKAQYDYDPDANNSAMTHYVNLMREARELVIAMTRIRPSEELTNEITTKILSPLVRQSILLGVEEAKRLREDLKPILDVSQYKSFDGAIKRMLERFASRLEGETETLTERLQKILQASAKQRNQSSPTPSNASSAQKSKLH